MIQYTLLNAKICRGDRELIELKNISYEINGKLILDNINLKIYDRFVAITGPNGSGKSTLAKIIMGILTPTAGSIIFNGEDITNLSVNERADRGISFAFQQPVHFKGLRVGDLLKLAYSGEKNLQDACAILSEVGLCARDYQDRELNSTLSGGEMKRIEIAMTAARGTSLSIFDEPEAGIDLWSFQSLIKVFEKLYEKTSGSIVIISHQERILNIADKIIYLKEGKVERYDEGRKVLCEIGQGDSRACSVLNDKMN